MSLVSELEKKEMSLTGSKATETDVIQLVERLPSDMVPSWLPPLLQRFGLAGACFSLDEDDDESELGAELKWFSVSQMLEEALMVYPGKSALRLGYLPVAACLAGSGDPYFLKISISDEDPPLVRIPHEMASDDEAYPESEIEIVCKSLSRFFRKVEIA